MSQPSDWSDDAAESTSLLSTSLRDHISQALLSGDFLSHQTLLSLLERGMTELLSQPPSTLAWLRQTPADPARWRVWQRHVHRLRLLEAGEAAFEDDTEDDTAKPSQEPGARRPNPRPSQPAPSSQGSVDIQRQADILLRATCAPAHPLTRPSIPSSSLGSEGRHDRSDLSQPVRSAGPRRGRSARASGADAEPARGRKRQEGRGEGGREGHAEKEDAGEEGDDAEQEDAGEEGDEAEKEDAGEEGDEAEKEDAGEEGDEAEKEDAGEEGDDTEKEDAGEEEMEGPRTGKPDGGGGDQENANADSNKPLRRPRKRARLGHAQLVDPLPDAEWAARQTCVREWGRHDALRRQLGYPLQEQTWKNAANLLLHSRASNGRLLGVEEVNTLLTVVSSVGGPRTLHALRRLFEGVQHLGPDDLGRMMALPSLDLPGGGAAAPAPGRQLTLARRGGPGEDVASSARAVAALQGHMDSLDRGDHARTMLRLHRRVHLIGVASVYDALMEHHLASVQQQARSLTSSAKRATGRTDLAEGTDAVVSVLLRSGHPGGTPEPGSAGFDQPKASLLSRRHLGQRWQGLLHAFAGRRHALYLLLDLPFPDSQLERLSGFWWEQLAWAVEALQPEAARWAHNLERCLTEEPGSLGPGALTLFQPTGQGRLAKVLSSGRMTRTEQTALLSLIPSRRLTQGSKGSESSSPDPLPDGAGEASATVTDGTAAPGRAASGSDPGGGSPDSSWDRAAQLAMEGGTADA